MVFIDSLLHHQGFCVEPLLWFEVYKGFNADQIECSSKRRNKTEEKTAIPPFCMAAEAAHTGHLLALSSVPQAGLELESYGF